MELKKLDRKIETENTQQLILQQTISKGTEILAESKQQGNNTLFEKESGSIGNNLRRKLDSDKQ